MDRKTRIKAWVAVGLMLLASAPAFAAGLGRLTVLSALGQPFSAEIDLLSVDKKDLGSIQASFATLEAFREAKIERAPVLSSLRFSVEQRKNGDPFIKIVSTKPIDEPFLDMLIQFDWPSGRLVREYTVLLDPPDYSEKQVAVAPVVPVVKHEQAAPVAEKPASMPASAMNPEVRANIPLDKKLLGKNAAKPKAAAEAKPASDTYGPVKKGESLSVIASSISQKTESVSLDQVLVAMFESNKQAFSGNNMNRLKVGQILKIPATAQIEEVKANDAAKQVKAHSADWNAYRQKLAAAVEAAPVHEEAAKPAASGKITTAVEDKAAAKAPSKDVLRLSKNEGAAGTKPAVGGGKESQAMKTQIQVMQEEATANEKAIKDANQRIIELEKNIKEMQRLLELKSHGMADLQKQAAALKTPPAAPAPEPAQTNAAEEKPAVPQAEPAPAKAEKPPVKKPKKAPALMPPKQPELSPLDELMAGNPLYLGGAAAVLLLLGMLGARAMAARRRKTAESFVDSVMTQGDLKANTVLGGTSGGRVDTSDTSFLTDFSQAGLGSIDSNEVDPLAEAEVYMAYGRDAQAEEILKEALVKDPGRHEIRLKLLEIYAGRKSLIDFEAVAGVIYAALDGQASPIWDKVVEMGRALDPQNPLYHKELKAVAPTTEADSFDKTMIAASDDLVGAVEPEAEVQPEADLDLDSPAEAAGALDFNLDAVAPMEEGQPAEEAQPVEEVAADLGFNLDLGTLAGAEEQAEQPVEEAAPETQEPAADTGLDFNLDMEAPAAAEAEPVTEESPVEETASEAILVADAPLENVMEFDFNTLLQSDAAAPAVEEESVVEEEPNIEEESAAEEALEALVIEEEPVVEEVPAVEEEPIIEEESAAEEELVAEEAPAVEEAPVIEEASAVAEEGLISADSWRDEVMSLDLEAVASAAPAELPSTEDEMVEVGGEEEASVLDIPDFLATGESVAASKEDESIELAEPPAEEALLEYDFDLGHEETAAAPEEVKESAAPDLDFSDISLEMDKPAAAKTEELPDEYGSEEVSTKLDLARAYMDMGDKEGARDILQEVLKEGVASQQAEANKLLAELD